MGFIGLLIIGVMGSFNFLYCIVQSLFLAHSATKSRISTMTKKQINKNNQSNHATDQQDMGFKYSKLIFNERLAEPRNGDSDFKTPQRRPRSLPLEVAREYGARQALILGGY